MTLFIDKNLIGESWIVAENGATIDVVNPATGETLGRVPDLSEQEILRAIKTAHDTQKSWAATTAYERSALLRKWFDLIVEHKEELSAIMTQESGKPLAESRAEMDYAASFIEWYAEEAKRLYGRTIPSNVAGRDILTIKQPIGVAAMITPWNFPSSMITRKLGPAFAAGCTAIVKPDRRTPYSALALGKLAQQAGFPSGVLNVVTGDSDVIGKVFTSDKRIGKVSFTGSTRVGRLLMEQSGPTLKKLSLELGGNAPFIVFDSADVSHAVDGLLTAKIRNAGQTCVCPNRIYVQDKAHDAFVATVIRHLKDMKIGNGMEDGVKVGPLIDQKAVEKVDHLVQSAVTHGAQLLLGGKRHKLGGSFYEPTVLTNVKADMDISREEIFGPVIAIQKFELEKDVIHFANETEFGLVSYVYTNDTAQAQRMMHALESGMVGVNTGMVSFAGAPFGGVKQSGIGREGGIEGIDAYLETKYIALQA